MVILDSNILIYLANRSLDRSSVAGVDIGFASITKIETLGYHKILVQEQYIILALMNEARLFPLTDAVIDQAVVLRQIRNIGLGDAIIAATALVEGIELWTANTTDFEGIRGLKLHNPIVR
jgi:predicted nucleic acid-binding protein